MARMSAKALDIAIIAPAGEARSIVDDLASGLAARGHRVRMHPWSADCERVLRRLRVESPDVVSQHASDPRAFALIEGLPVLHTLHAAPSAALLEASAASRASFAALSSFMARAWHAAGLQRIQLIPGGAPEARLPPAVVRPVALVADRTGALAALRARLGIRMAALGEGQDLWRRLAHSAVCVPATSGGGDFDRLAALAQLAGCPVVGYAHAALAEIVEQDVSGILVAPGEQSALAAAARRALLLHRDRVRASARNRVALGPMLDRYETELRALARRSAVRLVA